MKVLMFGWEFPPHISGGLGTACHGLTKSLQKEGVEILFVVPRAYGDESIDLINASEIPLDANKIKIPEETLQITKEGDKIVTWVVPSAISPYTSLGEFEQVSSIRKFNYQVTTVKSGETKGGKGFRYKFSGGYGPALLDEVKRYAVVAYEIARKNDFDVIHAHDWLTYPAGIAAKEASGKPLVVHVHATEYDRAGNKIDPRVCEIERKGMMSADRVIAVSKWTKKIISRRYHIPPKKITVVHNGIFPKHETPLSSTPAISKHIVTFLGRITYQKGPQYFIEAARKVLKKFRNAHFIMAGAGDLLPRMIDKVAQLRLSSHFHFTGFLKSDQVDMIWSVSSVYVMPSVSEPFGISPLEAIQAGVPVIISNQSGVSEVIPHSIKVDFWDTDALADAICDVLKKRRLSKTLNHQAREEIKRLNWARASRKVKKVYHELTA